MLYVYIRSSAALQASSHASILTLRNVSKKRHPSLTNSGKTWIKPSSPHHLQKQYFAHTFIELCSQWKQSNPEHTTITGHAATRLLKSSRCRASATWSCVPDAALLGTYRQFCTNPAHAALQAHDSMGTCTRAVNLWCLASASHSCEGSMITWNFVHGVFLFLKIILSTRPSLQALLDLLLSRWRDYSYPTFGSKPLCREEWLVRRAAERSTCCQCLELLWHQSHCSPDWWSAPLH